MHNHRYDESAAIAQLSRLPPKLMVLPALLAATRLVPAYVRFHAKTGRGDAEKLLESHAALWGELAGTSSLSAAEAKHAAAARSQSDREVLRGGGHHAPLHRPRLPADVQQPGSQGRRGRRGPVDDRRASEDMTDHYSWVDAEEKRSAVASVVALVGD
jgi:hypothetical protein